MRSLLKLLKNLFCVKAVALARTRAAGTTASLRSTTLRNCGDEKGFDTSASIIPKTNFFSILSDLR
jgi:hypothetical protein